MKLSLPKNYKCIKSFQFFSVLALLNSRKSFQAPFLEFFLQNVPNRIFLNFGKKCPIPVLKCIYRYTVCGKWPQNEHRLCKPNVTCNRHPMLHKVRGHKIHNGYDHFLKSYSYLFALAIFRNIHKCVSTYIFQN